MVERQEGDEYFAALAKCRRARDIPEVGEWEAAKRLSEVPDDTESNIDLRG
jgi:hypothetical protein